MLYFSRANRGSFSSHITVEDLSAKGASACVVRASMEVVADTKRRGLGKTTNEVGAEGGSKEGSGAAVKEGPGAEEREKERESPSLVDIWGLGF